MITLYMVAGFLWAGLLWWRHKRGVRETNRLAAMDGRTRDLGGRGGF